MPETNGDRVRKMTDEQLRDLWNRTFNEDMFPSDDVCSDGRYTCKWLNYSCECCPETFFNWLQAEAEDEKD